MNCEGTGGICISDGAEGLKCKCPTGTSYGAQGCEGYYSLNHEKFLCFCGFMMYFYFSTRFVCLFI